MFKRKYIPPPTIKAQKKGFDAANLEAARIIAAEPGKYPGLMAEWSKAILPADDAPEYDEMPLFRRSA
jgi:hypothetical protein